MVKAVRLIDRYRLEERLAAGGMGTVYEATDERLNRRVAVKLLKEELAGDPLFVERFRREARAVAGLSHPNIASVFDYGAEDGRDFIVMELIEGHDLAELLRSGPLEPNRAAAIAAQSCDALAHAHDAGIVHRDVKPGNIIISDSDRVKVTDFGIARAIGETTLTAIGSVLGTAHYLAPEQASGESVGPGADQYAMGVVLFEMLTGEVPFSGTSPIGIAMQHVSDEMPAPSSVVPEVPATLDEVTARATAKVPSERYPDISAMASALRAGAPSGALAAGAAALGAAATAPLADPSGTQVMRPQSGWSPRRAGRGALAALVILALLALGLVASRLLSAPTESSKQAGGSRDRKQDQAAAKPSPTPSPTPSPSDTATPFALPSVVGSDYESAAQTLSDEGLVPVRIEDPEAEAPPEEVVDTDPDPGVEVSPGDSIDVVVAVPGPPEEDPGKGKGKNKNKNNDEGGEEGND